MILEIKQELQDRFGFTPTRVDRMVHASGFDQDGAELRSVFAGSNRTRIVNTNGGVEGPLAIEAGYGCGSTRVRLFRGVHLLRVWDLAARADLAAWYDEFDRELAAAIKTDATSRSLWAVTQAAQVVK